MTNINNRPIIIWLYTGCILIFTMVILGGVTRLTGSGLSITEWNIITGTLPPLNESQWEQEFIKYQQSPQFKKINSDFGLEQFKNIYWWEYIHRLLGRLIGIVFIIPFFYFLLKKQINRALIPKLILIFLLGAWQGFLGWYMVKSGLLDEPYVSHYRLSIHLINAFLTFGYTFWVTLDLKYTTSKTATHSPKLLLRLTILIFILLVLQIIYGGFVAGLHAGHIYNTWPMMGDQWVADSVWAALQNQGFMSLFCDISVVQFIHRMLAILIFSLVLFIWLKRKSSIINFTYNQNLSINVSMGFVLIQVLLGIFTLIYNVPVWLGVAHQAGAFLIFGAILFQWHRLLKG